MTALDRDHPRVILANKLFCDESISPDEICATLKIFRSTLNRSVSIRGNGDVRSETHT
jgi:hypothetical protein